MIVYFVLFFIFYFLFLFIVYCLLFIVLFLCLFLLVDCFVLFCFGAEGTGIVMYLRLSISILVVNKMFKEMKKQKTKKKRTNNDNRIKTKRED